MKTISKGFAVGALIVVLALLLSAAYDSHQTYKQSISNFKSTLESTRQEADEVIRILCLAHPEAEVCNE